MDCIDDFFMSIYLVECMLKMYVMRKEYFKAWDLLDFNIVLISLFDIVIGVLDSFSPTGSVLFTGSVSASGLKVTKVLRLLRATRMFRVLRTLKFIDRLQKYTVTILKSIKSLGPILQLTGAFVFMATSLGCSLFGGLIPKHFGNIILTFFTLIKIITLDDWFEIQQDGSVEYGFNIPLCLYLGGFIFIMVFVIFNLLLAVLVDTFNVSNDENRWKLENEEARMDHILSQKWSRIQAQDVSENESDEEFDSDELLGDENLTKKKIQEDFSKFFEGCLPTDFTLNQWYYRILPAIEKQKFHFDNQITSYERMTEEAIASTDEAWLYTGT